MLEKYGSERFEKDEQEWYRSVWCEELLITGWKRMWNPLDPSLGWQANRFGMPPEIRSRVERFELARWIEVGYARRPNRTQAHKDLGLALLANGWSTQTIMYALFGKYQNPKAALEQFRQKNGRLNLSTFMCPGPQSDLLGVSWETLECLYKLLKTSSVAQCSAEVSASLLRNF